MWPGRGMPWQAMLALYYHYGEGLTKDERQARRYAELAWQGYGKQAIVAMPSGSTSLAASTFMVWE